MTMSLLPHGTYLIVQMSSCKCSRGLSSPRVVTAHATSWRLQLVSENPDLQLLESLMAVEVGFEPTEVLPPHTLSRRARSATTRLHRR